MNTAVFRGSSEKSTRSIYFHNTIDAWLSVGPPTFHATSNAMIIDEITISCDHGFARHLAGNHTPRQVVHHSQRDLLGHPVQQHC